MAKKGREKSSAPAASSTSKQKKPPAEDDFIIFTNSDKEPKAKKGSSGPAGSSNKAANTADGGDVARSFVLSPNSRAEMVVNPGVVDEECLALRSPSVSSHDSTAIDRAKSV